METCVFRLLRTVLTPEEDEETRTGAVTAHEIANEVPLSDWDVMGEWVEPPT